MNLQFKSAEKTDIHLIHDLAVKIWNQHYISIIGKKQVDYMLNKMYSADALLKQMEKGDEFTLVYYDGTIIGYASVSKENEKYFLHKIYVDQSLNTKGVGTALLNYLFTKYNRANSFELTVNRQNYKAINFYFKHGFKIQSVEDFDIGNGYYMNDFIMVKKMLS